MFKKGVCFLVCLVLGLSMMAPAFVHADEPTPSDYSTEFSQLNTNQLKALTAIANAHCLGQEVKVYSVFDNIEEFLDDFGSWAWDKVHTVGDTVRDAVLWTEDQVNDILGINEYNSYYSAADRKNVRFDPGTVRALVGGRLQNYPRYTYGNSVEGGAFPSYVPDEYRAYLSYLNTWDDLNLASNAIPSSQVIITTTVNPDYSKFFYAPGSRYSWYYDDTMQPHGLLYYFNGWDDLYVYPTYSYNMNLPYSNPVYSFNSGTDSYGGRYPGVVLYNDRVRILLNPSTNWGDDNEYTLNLIAYSGYNNDTYTIAPSSLTLSQFKWPEFNYSYRYSGSETIYDNGHGALGSIGISDYNYGLIDNISGGNLPSPSVRIIKRSDDKLLDTIATLVEYMRNVDVYVGQSWETATIWYQPDFESGSPDVEITPTSNFIPVGGDNVAPIIYMPNGGTINIYNLYVYLKDNVDPSEPFTVGPGDIPDDVFPGEDGGPDGTTPTMPTDLTIAYYPPNIPGDVMIPVDEFLHPDSEDDGGLGSLFSRSVSRLVGVAPDQELNPSSEDDMAEYDSPVAVATDIVQAASTFLGPFVDYIWLVIGIVIVAGLLVKLLHG